MRFIATHLVVAILAPLSICCAIENKGGGLDGLSEYCVVSPETLHMIHIDPASPFSDKSEHLFFECYKAVSSRKQLQDRIAKLISVTARASQDAGTSPIGKFPVFSLVLFAKGQPVSLLHLDANGRRLHFRGVSAANLNRDLFQELSPLLGNYSTISDPVSWAAVVQAVEAAVPEVKERRQKVEALARKLPD